MIFSLYDVDSLLTLHTTVYTNIKFCCMQIISEEESMLDKIYTR